MKFKDWYSLDESAELIAQSLLPESEDEDLKNILERGVVKTQHKQTLIKKAEAGKVSLHTSYLVQIPANEILFHLKHNAGLLKKNLEKYADEIEIKLFAAQATIRVQSKQEQQDKAILNQIEALGHDLLALPKVKSGSRSIKADIRDYFLNNSQMFTYDAFDNTWKRLKKEGKIK